VFIGSRASNALSAYTGLFNIAGAAMDPTPEAPTTPADNTR
jgi:hypothetical protein